MTLVHDTRTLRYPFDAANVLPRIEAAFAGTEVRVAERRADTAPNRIPEWVAVDLSATHGDYECLRATTTRLIEAAGLADEFKPEGADA